MTDEAESKRKRLRTTRPETPDILFQARMIWGRDPFKSRSTQSEDRDFREYFGCGPLVALSLWNLLATMDMVPSGGTLEHFMWTLMFLKLYTKESPLCNLAGGVDRKTFSKWVWLFIFAISGLESTVVSILTICCNINMCVL